MLSRVTMRFLVLLVPLVLVPSVPAAERVGTLLPEGAYHTPGGRYVDYTTPGAAALLDEVARELDVPLAGQRSVRRVVVLDRLDAKTYMTASPPDTVLIGRAAIEELSGQKITRADPGSVERALRALLADPRKADVFKGLFAHEIGHLAQGHGRSLAVGSPASRAATAERVALQHSLGNGRWSAALEDSAAQFARERAAARDAARQSPASQAIFAADRARVEAGLARGASLADSTRFLMSRQPAVPSGFDAPVPARHERVMELTRWVSQDASRAAGGAAFKLQRFMPPITVQPDGTRTGTRAVAAALTPERPLPFLHADEYLADQHAVTLRYRQTGSIERSLAVFDGLGKNATWLQSDHPMRQTRLLNAVAHIQENPRLFADGLAKPVSVPVYADLPPVVLSRSPSGIQVTGAEAVRARVAAPDLMILDRYRQAQNGYRGWVARHEARPVLGKLVPRTSDALVAEGVAGRAASGIVRGGLTGAVLGTAMIAATGGLADAASWKALGGGLVGGTAASLAASALSAGLSTHWAGRLLVGAAGVVGGMAGADLARGATFDLARALVGGLATGVVMAALGPGLLPGLAALGAGIAADALYAWWTAPKAAPEAPPGRLALLDVRATE